jgi:hypothetical protein
LPVYERIEDHEAIVRVLAQPVVRSSSDEAGAAGDD